MTHTLLMFSGTALLICTASGCAQDKDTDAESPICTEAGTSSWDGTSLSHTSQGCAEVSLTARILGTGDLTVELTENDDGGWTPTISSESGGTFGALVLEGPWHTHGEDDAVLWRGGYQSWSWSGVMALEPLTLDDAGVPEVGGDGDALTVIHESPGTSWWVGLAGKADGASLLMGQQGATKTRFFAAYDDQTAWAVWGHRGDEITLEAGEALTLDPLWLQAGADPWQLHTDYADAVTRQVGTALPETPPITGWATWYQYFEDITEADVRANFAPAAALGLEVFQIDDGWQRLWGDWQADEGFPSGMQGLAADIKAEGFIPGLWMAPMYVHRDTQTYQDHPDWWVRDLDGDELSFSNLGTGDYAVIDVTHPDAAQWLTEVIAAKVDEGWEYFKFDFLYAAAQVGERHQDVTSIEAYHQAMTLLREAIGDHWFLACGAPMLPSVGYAESFRSGADIAFGFDRIPTLAYLRWQARSTASRAFANGRWWWLDADQILVREPLTDAATSGPLVANAVSGGVWMLGDDLTALPADRQTQAMTEEVVALRGQTPVPDDPLLSVSGLDGGPVLELSTPDDAVPTTWRFPDGQVALLNLSQAAITLEGPGGTELLSGQTADPGPRTLEAGVGEIWRP